MRWSEECRERSTVVHFDHVLWHTFVLLSLKYDETILNINRVIELFIDFVKSHSFSKK